MRRPQCVLAALQDEFSVPGIDRHVRSCLRCQAVAARNRRLARELAGLRRHHLAAPPQLAQDVERRLGPLPATRSSPLAVLGSRAATVGAVVATAAGAAVLVFRRLGHEVL